MIKTDICTVPKWGGRDDGKVFLITEMPAAQAEKWAWRLVIACKGTTAEIPDSVALLGMAGLTIRLLNGVLAADVRFADLETLLDEMFTCVTIIRDTAHPEIAAALIPSDIEEVYTRAWLRSEVIRLHTNFSPIDGISALLTLIRGQQVSSSM